MPLATFFNPVFPAAFLFCIFSSNLLAGQPEIELALQARHEQAVHLSEYSADGRYIATASYDGAIKIWEARTGFQVKTIILNSPAQALAFHPGGREIVATQDNDIVAYTIPEGKEKYRLKKHRHEVLSLAFSTDGALLASGDSEGVSLVWQMDGRRVLARLFQPADFSIAIQSLCFSADSRYLYTAGDDIYAKKWDWKKRKVARQYGETYNTTNSIALSPDGKWLAAGSNEAVVKIWNEASGQLAQVLRGYDAPVEVIRFHPNGQQLYAGYFDGYFSNFNALESNTDGHLAAWNMNSFQPEYDIDLPGAAMSLALSPDGDMLLVAGDNKEISIWHAPNGQFIHNLGVFPSEANTLLAHPATGLLLVGAEEPQIKVWDPATAAIRQQWPAKQPGPVTAIGVDTTHHLMAAAHGRRVEVWKAGPDWENFTFVNQFEVEGGIVKKLLFTHREGELFLVRTNEKEYFEAFLQTIELLNEQDPGSPFPPEPTTEKAAYLEVWDALEGRLSATFDSYEGLGTEVSFHPPSGLLVFAGPGNSMVHINWYSQEVLGHIPAHEALATVSRFSPGSSFMVTGGLDPYFLAWNLESMEMKKMGRLESPLTAACFHPTRPVVAIATGKAAQVWDIQEGQLLFSIPTEAELLFLEYTPDGRYLAGAGHGSPLFLWDARNGRLMATLIGAGEDEYFSLTPDNYYRSSKRTADVAAFRYRGNLYRFDQFDLLFNRPDKVLETLNNQGPLWAALKRAYEKRAGTSLPPGPQPVLEQLPEIELSSPETGNTTTTATIASINVRASDPNGLALDRLQLYANGVPLYTSDGRPLEGRGHSLEMTLEVELAPGLNIIEAEISNERGWRSLRRELQLFCSAPETKGNLYLITIGAGKYREASQNLSFADKDAQAVAALFQANEQGYHQVHHFSFTNEAVSTNILPGLKQALMNSSVKDQAILFYAGHGLLSSNYDYYLAAYDTDFSRPENGGIAYTQLERLLEGIPARRKLILLDACHAGKVDSGGIRVIKAQNIQEGSIKFRGDTSRAVLSDMNENYAFELMQELFAGLGRGTGANVLAGARGIEYAIEDESFGSGIFTYCLLKALGSQQQADLDGDGDIFVSELEKYMMESVSRATGGRQRPILRSENRMNNWRIVTSQK